MLSIIHRVILQTEDNYDHSYSHKKKTLLTSFFFLTFHNRKMCKPEKFLSICKFLGIIFGVIILMVNFSINFIIAFAYKNQCPVQYWIWLYNIVAGTTGVFMTASWIIAAIFYQTCNKRLGWCFFLLGLFILLFEMIWIIISLVEIVPLWTQPIVQYTNPALNTYCHPALYNTTRILLVMGAVCIGLIGGNAGFIAVEFSKS